MCIRDSDYLSFSIDGLEIDKWAGEIEWSLESFPINSGIHTFEWKYIKDQAVIGGLDAAWIDFIVFPPIYNNECPNDINGDCMTNVLDIVILINFILMIRRPPRSTPSLRRQRQMCIRDRLYTN